MHKIWFYLAEQVRDLDKFPQSQLCKEDLWILILSLTLFVFQNLLPKDISWNGP